MSRASIFIAFIFAALTLLPAQCDLAEAYGAATDTESVFTTLCVSLDRHDDEQDKPSSPAIVTAPREFCHNREVKAIPRICKTLYLRYCVLRE